MKRLILNLQLLYARLSYFRAEQRAISAEIICRDATAELLRATSWEEEEQRKLAVAKDTVRKAAFELLRHDRITGLGL